MNKNIIDTIYEKMPHMSQTDKKISEVVLRNPQKTVDFTISELSKLAQVSDASVSRFCKNLSLSGFHQLKVELAKASQNEDNYYKELDKDNVGNSIKSILDNKIVEIKNTIEGISKTELKEIMNILKKSRIVQFAAEGDTYIVAQDAEYKFNQIGRLAISSNMWENALAQTLNMSSQDCVVAISNSGESSRLLKQIEEAKKKEIKVIAITNHSESPLALLADYHIKTTFRQRVLQSEYYFSRVAAMSVIELLFLLLIVEDKQMLESIKNHEELIAVTKI